MQSSENVELSADCQMLRPRLNPERWPFLNSQLNVDVPEFVPRLVLDVQTTGWTSRLCCQNYILRVICDVTMPEITLRKLEKSEPSLILHRI